jgi:hypothetical protein
VLSERIDADPLQSLESHGTPTIHNMILSDSVVAKFPSAYALGYAPFERLQPSENGALTMTNTDTVSK